MAVDCGSGIVSTVPEISFPSRYQWPQPLQWPEEHSIVFSWVYPRRFFFSSWLQEGRNWQKAQRAYRNHDKGRRVEIATNPADGAASWAFPWSSSISLETRRYRRLLVHCRSKDAQILMSKFGHRRLRPNSKKTHVSSKRKPSTLPPAAPPTTTAVVFPPSRCSQRTPLPPRLRKTFSDFRLGLFETAHEACRKPELRRVNITHVFRTTPPIPEFPFLALFYPLSALAKLWLDLR